MKKRDFIKTSLLGVVGIATVPSYAKNSTIKYQNKFLAIPASEDICSQTDLFSSHDIEEHHIDFFSKPTKALNNLDLNSFKSREIFQNDTTYSPETLQHVGAFYNHRLFFKSISQRRKNLPSGELAKLINDRFGSSQKFKEELTKHAVKTQGNGWLWLIAQENEVRITHTKQNFNPLMQSLKEEEKGFPILAVDMWDHAHSSFDNKKEYISKFWDSINWKHISGRIKRAKSAGYLA